VRSLEEDKCLDHSLAQFGYLESDDIWGQVSLHPRELFFSQTVFLYEDCLTMEPQKLLPAATLSTLNLKP